MGALALREKLLTLGSPQAANEFLHPAKLSLHSAPFSQRPILPVTPPKRHELCS
jgi:hypothetical protein